MKQCKYDNELTLIIPFLNEGEEVYNTVKNLRENSVDNFNIILINDASSDGYNYQSIAQQFDATYIEHSERKGVAFSRDEGVEICSTQYFLLLDAHMRIFQNDWVALILKELQEDQRALFCCKTLSLDEKGNLLEEGKNREGCGAYFNFDDLSANWITHPLNETSEIPCVLGASYACSKSYWKYLQGLEGLKSYGMDEQFISIKVWLEGGSCKLIKSVTFGHIFRPREQVPYEPKTIEFFYNQFLLAELFFEDIHEVLMITRTIKKRCGKELFNNVLEEFFLSKNDILNKKVYLEKISNRKINYIYDANENFRKKK